MRLSCKGAEQEPGLKSWQEKVEDNHEDQNINLDEEGR